MTYVREGVLVHGDDLGNRGQLVAGDVQTISAGSGVRHQEYTEKDGAKIYQIWLKPLHLGGKPTWGHKSFPKAAAPEGFVVLASDDPADGGLHVDAKAKIYRALLPAGATVDFPLPAGSQGYLVVSGGAIAVNQLTVHPDDGLVIRDEKDLRFEAQAAAEVVLVLTA